jgi:galactose-1-phosphate uridylyltransferase
MKITNEQLKQIIKEEIDKVFQEMTRDDHEFKKRRK